MNLPQFLKQVDKITKLYSKQELAEFIHQRARVLPESGRTLFLEQLAGIGEVAAEERPAQQDLKDEIAQALEGLRKIEEEDLGIVGNLNEEYDEWYHEEEDEYMFEDPDHVLDIIENAYGLVHRCVDAEFYREAYELYRKLVSLELSVEGDYLDCGGSGMDFDELISQQLLDVDIKEFCLDALLAAYHALPLEERPEAMYHIFRNAGYDELTLESVLQRGASELEDVPEFLEVWTAYLGGSQDREATRLLLEAISLMNRPDRELELARNFHELHPAIYEHILTQDRSPDELLSIGQEALRTILPCYVIRARIALRTARIAEKMGNTDEVERCWLEAFRSDTRLVNYLRLAVESREPEKYQAEMRAIYQAQQSSARENPYSYDMFPSRELDENQMGSTTYCALVFFDGDFRWVLEEGMKAEQPLGWSATFMKEGLALFLLLLYEEKELSSGCLRMCQKLADSLAFKAEIYADGLGDSVEENNALLFWECFSRWKSRARVELPEDTLEKLEHWISWRVEGILKATRRNYYNECAAFIAALGEVEESMGIHNGKQARLQEYRAAYPRHNAFHRELEAFGMRKTRKKR